MLHTILQYSTFILQYTVSILYTVTFYLTQFCVLHYYIEDIRCDVDENLWPNRQERQEV